MCTKRVASHEVKTIDGQTFSPGVVEMDGNGHVTRAYELEGEIAHTIWLGGKIEIRADSDGDTRAYKNNIEIT